MPVLFDLYLFKDRRDDVPHAIAGPYLSEESATQAYYMYFSDTYPVHEVVEEAT